MSDIRLQVHHTLYQWWGVPSRQTALVRHLDPTRFPCTLRGIPDVVQPADMPDWRVRIAALIAPELQRQHLPWHNLNDFFAEAETLGDALEDRIDIVHFLDGEHSGPGLPQHFRFRQPGVKCVATYHQPPALAEKVIHGPDLRHLDAIILVSPSQLPFFTRFVPRDRLHVILHGVDTAFFTPAKDRPPSDRLRCITTGLHLRDWDAFHAVARVLPEVDFTVVTSGRLTLEPLPNVEVRSGITDEALAEAYRMADVLFLPLLDATANNSLLEGMASGLPIVSTDLEAVRCYVPAEAGLLVDGNATQSLVDALTRLRQDPDLRKRMSVAARKRAEDLSWPSVARQHEALYASLAAGLPEALPSREPVPLPECRRHFPAARPMARSDASLPVPRDGALAALVDWSGTFHRLGLPREAAMIVGGLVDTYPDGWTVQQALAKAAEAEWRWTEAAAHWDQFLLLCPDALKDAGLAARATALAEAGDLSAAQETLIRAGGRFETRLAAARIATAYDRPDLAETAWQDCTTHYPDRIAGFLGLARLHLRQARFEAAETLLEHVRQVWPESAEAATLWARTADESGDLAEAERRWAAMRDRFRPGAVFGQDLARHLGQRNDLAACEALLSDLAPGPDRAQEFMLQFHVAARSWSQAADLARDCAMRRPDSPALRLRCADLLLRLGTPDATTEALDILRNLRKQAPEAAAVVPSLARALITKGEQQEAQAIISALPARRRDDPSKALHLWGSLAAEGNRKGLQDWTAVFQGFGHLSPDPAWLCAEIA